MNAADKRYQRARDAAERLFALLRDRRPTAQREAAKLMEGVLGSWMDSYFLRLGTPAQEAEELTMDVWIKLLRGQYADGGNPYALLCRMRKSRFVDYLKQRSAAKRSADDATGRHAEIAGDDELWDYLIDTVAAPEPPHDLQDCVQRKFSVFEADAPARASLLQMLAEGLSYREIASIVFDIDEAAVDQKRVARVRNRIEEARKQAVAYFEECKE